MDIKNLAKIDLHCHLDGSLRRSMIQKYVSETVTQEMLTAPETCRSLTEYLGKFDLPLRALQDEDGLREGAFTFAEDAAKDHVKYVEVRFAPMLSAHDSLNCTQIIEAVREGMERGKESFGVHYGIIVCAMRHHSVEQNMAMLRSAREFLGDGVCALDLAGDESAFPTQQFRELFHEAKRIGMPFTIHSGETGSVGNVREAYALGAKRIGHGIALKKDPELMRAYAQAGIGVEMCPTSNFQTKAVRSWEEYPLPEFVEAGIPVSVHTDNRTVSGTTMTQELTKIYEQYGRDEDLVMKLLENAARTAFVPGIRELFQREWKE